MRRSWIALTGERRVLQAQVALRLVDDFTAGPPLGRLRLVLHRADGAGSWTALEESPVLTPGGVHFWPKLGLTTHPAQSPEQSYRVAVEAELYRARHLVGGAWSYGPVEFTVRPYNHTNPLPIGSLPRPRRVFLLPSAAYPHAPHIEVLRGLVTRPEGRPVAGALVRLGLTETVLTDDRGSFALPVRHPRPSVAGNITIDIEVPATGQIRSVSIAYPAGFGVCQKVEIP